MKGKPKGLGLRPLSFLNYYRNNLKSSLAITLALVLSIFMIIIFQMVIFSVNEPARLGDVRVVSYVSKIYPGDRGTIDRIFLAKLKKSREVERVIPVNIQDTLYNHFFGTCNINIYSIGNKDMKNTLNKLGVRIVQGRLPYPGRKEIAIDERLVNNKNKRLGDFFGKAVDPKEKLPGKYKIVGILTGNCIIGVISIEDKKAQELSCILAAPKAGQLERFNSWIISTPHNSAYVWTKKQSEDNYNEKAKSLNTIFGVMSVAIIFVMAFASGNVSYAQYFSRRYEFGILESIGYTKGQILRRAAKEIGILNLLGSVFGILLSVIAGSILKNTFFEPHGYPFLLLQYDGIIKALTIPFCTAIFGLIPAGWLLSKIDPMLVIEKFE